MLTPQDFFKYVWPVFNFIHEIVNGIPRFFTHLRNKKSIRILINLEKNISES